MGGVSPTSFASSWDCSSPLGSWVRSSASAAVQPRRRRARSARPVSPPGPGSRAHPVPLGKTGGVGNGWRIRVVSVEPNAERQITAVNGQYGESPPPNAQDYMILLSARYAGAGLAKSGFLHGLRVVGKHSPRTRSTVWTGAGPASRSCPRPTSEHGASTTSSPVRARRVTSASRSRGTTRARSSSTPTTTRIRRAPSRACTECGSRFTSRAVVGMRPAHSFPPIAPGAEITERRVGSRLESAGQVLVKTL
jgi:hypothetical protein